MPIDSALQQAQEALEAQQNGQMANAIARYEQVLQQGYYSANLYNNLGLAYAKQGQLGRAIVQWERALRQEPLNEDAQHNLRAAQQHIARPITATEPIALVKFWRGLHHQATAEAWGWLFVLLWSMAVLAMGYAWQAAGAAWRSHVGTKIALVVLLLSSLPLSLGLAQQAQEQERGTAIVVAQQAGMRPYPELSSEEMEVLSEGVRVQIIDTDGEWVKIQLPNYLVGWLPKSLLEQV
jgi:tetratricopeptide (TPR) repeat protein